jgi:hypothetical protein
VALGEKEFQKRAEDGGALYAVVPSIDASPAQHAPANDAPHGNPILHIQTPARSQSLIKPLCKRPSRNACLPQINRQNQLLGE